MSKLALIASMAAVSKPELLPTGSYIGELVSVTEVAPAHKDADFDASGEPGQVSFTMRSLRKDGSEGRISIYGSLVGFEKFDEVKTDAQAEAILMAPKGFNKAGELVLLSTEKPASVTAADWKKKKGLERFRALFRPSEMAGEAVHRATGLRLLDAQFDENGGLLISDDEKNRYGKQGKNTKAAAEITGSALNSLGFDTLGEALLFNPNTDTKRYAKLVVEAKEYNEQTRNKAKFKGEASAEDFEAYCDKVGA